jgi:hypothetical protein
MHVTTEAAPNIETSARTLERFNLTSQLQALTKVDRKTVDCKCWACGIFCYAKLTQKNPLTEMAKAPTRPVWTKKKLEGDAHEGSSSPQDVVDC